MSTVIEVGLSSSLTLENGMVIKNRLFKSAMSEGLGTRDHNPKPDLATLYKTWADGGIGLMMTGNVMIERTALGEPGNVVLDDQSDLSEFRRWAEAGKANDAHIWMQLNHPGKQIPNFVCKEPVAPSAIGLENGLEKGFNKPRALTEPEIETIIQKFATSARLAKETGFQGVQIHGAHGYLVSQFLSPRHNQRDDQWGGSLENRMRFVLCVFSAIRAEVGDDYPIGIKLNSADFMRGGFTEEESMEVVKALADAGIDQIEISGGTYESPAMVGQDIKESTLKREAYFLEYAEKVRALVSTSLVVTGGFRSAKGMLGALESGATDMVGVARSMAIDPAFPNRLLSDPNAGIELRKLSTGITAIDQMAMLDVTWYENQLALMGQGKKPNPNLNPWISFFKTIRTMGAYALRSRRA
ncbi:MAG: NADH oxidase [Candidatus Hydrogenedentota bacterium]|nr:MAG: NADH oxidase [Candidatus Hydrogenedentota bacterium]